MGAARHRSGFRAGILMRLVIAAAVSVTLPSGAAPVGAPPQAGSTDRLYEVYEASYVEIDHALALLKTLGYNTIEYSAESAENGDRVFTPTTAEYQLPAIIKLIDPAKTHLDGQAESGFGRDMPEVTTSSPQQRLLIVYERQHLGMVEDLLNLLREKIDVPARQLLIEGFIVEIAVDDSSSLGLDFGGDIGPDLSFTLDEDSTTGDSKGLVALFDDNGVPTKSFFGRLSALVQKGDAEILATPSALVLDGRQVRIQVGSEIPVVTATATSAGFTTSVSNVSVGILLNLRPKLSEDGTEVSMQVETNVSEVVSQVTQSDAAGNVLFSAPVTGTRRVDSFVRVANDTPFILGGLIETEKRERITGVPVLSVIPLLGNLFRHRKTETTRKELIIVLTPHLIPVKQHNFRYVTPRMYETFETFSDILFHEAHRIEDSEVMDFMYVRNSTAFRNLRQRVVERVRVAPAILSDQLVRGVADGRVPGEEILVRRNLLELVRATGRAAAIPNASIYFNKETPSAPDGGGFTVSRVVDEMGAGLSPGDALVLSFLRDPQPSPEHPIPRPAAQVSRQAVGRDGHDELLRRANEPDPNGERHRSAVVLGGTSADGLRGLAEVLLVQEVLRLNPGLDTSLDEFRPGRQLIFPSEEALRARSFTVDEATARLFYEMNHYYRAFGDEFQRRAAEIDSRLNMSWVPSSPDESLPTAELVISCDEFEEMPHMSRSIELLQGQALELALCSNRSTGFTWPDESAFASASWLEPLEHTYRLGAPGTPPGAPGTETWLLRAAAPGSETFVLEYGQKWDGGDKGARSLELTVAVR